MKKTLLNIEDEFWCIVRFGDPKGYHTGVKQMETALFQFETATDMEEFLADGSIESGESMGDYVFKILVQNPDQRVLNHLIEEEKQKEKEVKFNRY